MTNQDINDAEQLWERYFKHRDEETKGKLVLHYLYIVGIVVKRLLPQYKDFSEKDELMSCGVFGLIDAVSKFDKSFGVQFQTYASVRIRGEIIDYLRKQDWAPTSLRKKINIIQEAYAALESQNKKAPTEEEIADYLGMKESTVKKVMQNAYMFNLINFEALLYHKDNDEYNETGSYDPYQSIENDMLTEALRKLIEKLPEREKMIVTLHYYEGLPLKNIASILSISESRVSQIHSKILLDMRAVLDS
jgi:RNA polymerase sigma factor for flagellar operon FliA